MPSRSPATHTFGNGSSEQSDQTSIDYTELSVGVSVEGHLTTGVETVGATRCPKCHRVGVICAEHVGSQMIVHTGIVHGTTLEGIDCCEISVKDAKIE